MSEFNPSQRIKAELVGRFLHDSAFNDGEKKGWKGLKIKDAQISMDECREDAGLWLTFSDGSEEFFYDNDTLVLLEEVK